MLICIGGGGLQWDRPGQQCWSWGKKAQSYSAFTEITGEAEIFLSLSTKLMEPSERFQLRDIKRCRSNRHGNAGTPTELLFDNPVTWGFTYIFNTSRSTKIHPHAGPALHLKHINVFAAEGFQSPAITHADVAHLQLPEPERGRNQHRVSGSSLLAAAHDRQAEKHQELDCGHFTDRASTISQGLTGNHIYTGILHQLWSIQAMYNFDLE